MRFRRSFSVLSMGYFRRSGEAGGSLRYPAYTQPDGCGHMSTVWLHPLHSKPRHARRLTWRDGGKGACR